MGKGILSVEKTNLTVQTLHGWRKTLRKRIVTRDRLVEESATAESEGDYGRLERVDKKVLLVKDEIRRLEEGIDTMTYELLGSWEAQD